MKSHLKNYNKIVVLLYQPTQKYVPNSNPFSNFLIILFQNTSILGSISYFNTVYFNYIMVIIILILKTFKYAAQFDIMYL